MENPDLSELMTLPEASKVVGLAYPTLAQYARQGRFRIWMIGRTRTTTLEELWKAIAQGKIGVRKF